MEPHFERLGGLVGDRLDDLAREADKTPPRLEPRDRQGEDRQRIVKAPAYREMERLALGDLALAAVSHRPALGWQRPLSAASKYALTYLFAQSEFGLLCPVNMTDSLTRTIRRFAAPELLERYLPGLLAEDLESQLQGAMFMTERFAGSDVGATETRARAVGRPLAALRRQVVLLQRRRRPGAGAGAAGRDAHSPDWATSGLGLFLMPRMLPSGAPNRYRIVRLKDKLGTRAMASGEIVLEGAAAWLVGDLGQGFKQMTEMVNQSRLSNGVRSAGMMRRAVHEALTVALGRRAFGERLIDLPLVRRQLIKMILPAEAALNVALFTADCLDRADAGDRQAQTLRRILTPLDQAARLPRRAQGDGRRHGDARRQRLHRGVDRAAPAARVAPGLDLGGHEQHHRARCGAGGGEGGGAPCARPAPGADDRPRPAAVAAPLAERLEAALALIERASAAGSTATRAQRDRRRPGSTTRPQRRCSPTRPSG